MITTQPNSAPFTARWNQVEVDLLTDVRAAEAAFKRASGDQKEQAGEQYRLALARFSALVLDRRFPPGFQLHS